MSSAISEAGKNKWIYLGKGTVNLPTKWDEVLICYCNEYNFCVGTHVMPYDLVTSRGITKIRFYEGNTAHDGTISTTQVSGISNLYVYYR